MNRAFRFIRLRTFRAALCAALMMTATLRSATVVAQQTRAELLEQQIADKETRVEPYRPGTIETAMIFVEENNILRRFSGRPEGWYPRLGGLTTGSGFAVGPGYRNYFGRDGVFDISAAASVKSYRAIDARLRSPSFARDRLAIEASTHYHFYPQERYFGLGAESRLDDRVSYRYEDVSARGGLLLWPKSMVRGAVTAGYDSATIGRGSGRFPSVETIFSPVTAPALNAHPAFFTAAAEIEVDYRDRPGNPRAGGRHRAAFTQFEDLDAQGFAFQRVDLEAMQLFPFYDQRRVIALRALASLTEVDEGSEVPFYLMPFIGGPETLRGYRERRFTDRNIVLVTAEYRYEVFAGLDMALFVDAATIGARRDRLSLGNVKTDYGIGFRFGTRENIILRFDIGRGSEGTRYFFKFGPAF